MASETRCTITVDEEHDPPRWVRVDGLRMLDMWDRAGINLAMCMIALVVIPIVLIFYFAAEWLTSQPPWVTFLLWLIFGAIAGFLILLYRRALRHSEIRALQSTPPEDQTIHFNAILAAFYIRAGWWSEWSRIIDADAFRDTYQSQSTVPPSVILYKSVFPEDVPSEEVFPQQITGDPPIAKPLTSRARGWIKLVFYGLLVLSTTSILSLLFSSDRSEVAWESVVAMVSTFLMSLFMIYQFSFAASRSAVQIDRGRVGFTKWFRRRSLASDDSLCTVYSMFGIVTLQWHRPGRKWPAHTIYFHAPNDPRLITILNLWTADPLPDNSG